MPRDAQGRARSQGYLRAWEAIGQLLSEGRSWSGRERNCCFLNTRDGQFANAAAVTGLDVPQDSRGVAVTDWDGDGDLDLWVSNRARPRVQLWSNPSRRNSHFLSLKLVGVNCNRDAIGARVDVRPTAADSTTLPLTRFVKAGDGFLSQSSKRLHFGLGDDTRAVDCHITWPDGQVETIEGLTCDQLYTIVQGEGLARGATVRVAAALSGPPDQDPDQEVAAARTELARTELVRIVPHGRLPLPPLAWRTLADQEVSVDSLAGRPVLLVLWASWCQPCLAELQMLASQAARWDRASLQIWALNVEDLELSVSERRATVERWADEYHDQLNVGLATTRTVELLDLLQRTVVSVQEPLPIPASFLLDPRGGLVALYKGPLDAAQLESDLGRLAALSPAGARDAAVPMRGRWYLNPIPPDLLAVPRRLLEIKRAQEADQYLRQHIGTPLHPRTTVDANWYALFQDGLGSAYFETGLELAKQRAFDSAEAAWRSALEVRAHDWETLAALASLYGQQRRYADTLATLREMQSTRPQDLIVANNVAWLLATAPDLNVRDVAAAIPLAESICERTQRRVASPLDTLAAAYAAAGRFDEAVRTAEQALERAQTQSNEAVRTAIRRRLDGYRQGQAYTEPPAAEPPAAEPPAAE